MTITIVGLGPGHIDDLTRRAWRVLETSNLVYLRTSRHPCVPDLPNAEAYKSFDEIYEKSTDFADVYNTIVERIIETAKTRDVVYAVPGDPYVGESTTPHIVERARTLQISVEIINGISFIEPILSVIGVDAMDHLQVMDGLDVATIHHPLINPDAPALIGQVYSRQVASDVKLTLMNQYPDDFEVQLIHGAGTDNVIVEVLPLFEIDRSDHINHLTSLYVPALGNMSSFERFQEIIAHLRAPEGCPWDREQTHASLRPFLIEEAYEVLEAIDKDDMQSLSEELGDLLLQIVLHTQIAIEDGDFYMSDVLSYVNNKMIVRHPHVWGDVSVDNPDDVVTNWEAIKRQEKADKGDTDSSLLDSIPKALPALLQAYKFQAKAAKQGFDWHEIEDVFAKVQEEITEIKDVQDHDPEKLSEEVGDLLFAIVNWIRWLGVEDVENALRDANNKFYRRFHYIEQQVKASGRLMTDYTLEELDAFWNDAKVAGL